MNVLDMLRRKTTGHGETPEMESALRTALMEPSAPGEEESYHRLMGVIAEDLRYRQPAPLRARIAWMPLASVGAAAAILAVVAYDAGLQTGAKLNATPPPIVAMAPKPVPAIVPRPSHPYAPVTKPAPTARPAAPPRATVKPSQAHPGAPDAILALVPSQGLSPDQREVLRAASDAAETGDWTQAAKSLQQLADTHPDSDLAVNALHMAAEIYSTKLDNPAAALDLYRREIQICQDQLRQPGDAHRKARLETQLERAEFSVSMQAAPVDDPAQKP